MLVSKLFSAKEFSIDGGRKLPIYNYINIGLDEILERIYRSLVSMLDNKLNRWPTYQEKIRLLDIYEKFGYFLNKLLINFKTRYYFCKKISDIIDEMIQKADLIIRNHIASEKMIDSSFVLKILNSIKVIIYLSNI
jgi:hypothetical protein